MRRLGADLRVNPMSIYHYVDSKAALLDGLLELIAEDAGQVAVGPGPWPEQLHRLADAFRERSLAHRNLIRYALTIDDFIQRDGPMWRSLCSILRTAGLREAEVPRVGAVLAAMVGGLLLTEVNGTMQRLVDGDESEHTGFPLAVRLLVDGVAARI